MRKNFTQGQLVEFQRDTLAYFRDNHGWECGFYIRKPDQWRGWHWVKNLTGEKFIIPSRRLRAAPIPEPAREEEP